MTTQSSSRSSTAAASRCRRRPPPTWPVECWQAEGVVDGELGIAFVGPDESRTLKREHLGIDEATDVLSFPIDGTHDLPPGPPRQLGDVVLCPQVVGDDWRRPLAHGLLHLLGYDHGPEMEQREQALAT